MSNITYIRLKDFDPAVKKMRNAGGAHRRRADKVIDVLMNLDNSATPLRALKRTAHGEGRIRHCVKYDLGDGYRLVTIQSTKIVAFCFVGIHTECDRWLDTNSGMTIGKGSDGTWQPIFQSTGLQFPLRRPPSPSSEHLLQRLATKYLDALLEGVSAATVLRLNDLGTLITGQELEQECKSIEPQKRRELVYDVLSHLAAGRVHDAVARLDLELGAAREVDELHDNEILEILDGDQLRRLRVGSAEHQLWLKEFARTADSTDWLLFLHPEQKRVVDADFTGPARLSGVSGSGKTCVAIHRSLRLARMAPSRRVLIVTLNRSLAELISRLVRTADPDSSLSASITVSSFFELSQTILATLEPSNFRLYSDVTWKLQEHVDEVFREFYRCWHNNFAAEQLLHVHHSLISQGITAETYVREEFDWIRSAFQTQQREKYLDVDRTGRRIPIQEDGRRRLLQGVADWETKMQDVGVIDYLGLTTAVSRHLDELVPQFDHIIVDEAQDFGTTELAILRHLCKTGPNDLFLCGDIAQHVLPKHRSMIDAGINTANRSRRIVLNYRNTREILKAAYNVLIANLDEGMLSDSDLEILDPEYANRSSSEPVVLNANSLSDEFAFARTLVKDILKANPSHRCCIAFAGYSIREIELFAKGLGLPVLSGDRVPLDDSLVLSDLEQTKGYEFNVVLILNCSEGMLPPTGAPVAESFRYSCRLYVAMTRSRDELYLSYSGSPSRWLKPGSDGLAFMRWEEVIELAPSLRAGVPRRLPEAEAGSSRAALELNGLEFLYTPAAEGLSLEAIRKIDELVDGTGLIRNQQRVKWKTMSSLRHDLARFPRARQLLGPTVHQELLAKLNALA